MKIPENYQTVMPYLIVDGAEDFLKFAQRVFGAGQLSKLLREDGKGIMHAEIRIGDSTIMFADATDQFEPCTAGLFIYVESADETYEKALAAGANPVMDLSDRSYGRACGVIDPFGNTWWITSVIER
jgi:PhnB protein